MFEERPKSGRARKLWDWFTRSEILDKPAGVPPDRIQSIRAGRIQRQTGAAQYEIEWNHRRFYVHDADSIIVNPAKPQRTDGFYYL